MQLGIPGKKRDSLRLLSLPYLEAIQALAVKALVVAIWFRLLNPPMTGLLLGLVVGLASLQLTGSIQIECEIQIKT